MIICVKQQLTVHVHTVIEPGSSRYQKKVNAAQAEIDLAKSKKQLLSNRSEQVKKRLEEVQQELEKLQSDNEKKGSEKSAIAERIDKVLRHSSFFLTYVLQIDSSFPN